MAAGQAFKFFIKVGKQILGTNSKNIADDLIKQGGKRIPKNKVPESATVKKAPSVPNPKSSSGKFVRPQPPAARPKTTAPAKPKAPAKPPAKPSVSSSAPAAPKPKAKPPAKPKAKTTAPARPSSTGSRSTGGRGRKKAPLMPKNMVKERPNLPPKPKGSGPALLRDSVRPEAPEIDLKAPTPKTKPNNKSGEMPKKKKEDPKRKTSPKPKLRPAAGPTTNESFGKAFARNRKAGNATFNWKGKKYTTRYKEESIAQHKKKFGVEGKY